ncbi:MAG: hypothetical protein PUB42_06620 [Firmicutes bacterium]|nr:hypothetical protein [Bacillota bacterium]
MSIKKGTIPPRYDEAFKAGAVKMVTEQGRPPKEGAAELGIFIDTLLVKDLCLKKIVGYAFSSHIDTNLTVSALEMAINRQKPQTKLIFHSDRGVQ